MCPPVPISCCDNDKVDLELLNNTDPELANGVSSLLWRFQSKSLKQLCGDNQNLLVYPPDFDDIPDKIGEETLFRFDPESKKFATGNLVGVLSLRSQDGLCVQISINSRFDSSDRQYFFFYMLERVLGLHLVDPPVGSSANGSGFDLSAFLFPKVLCAAMTKGVFRAVKTMRRNDDILSGSVDIDRHVQENVPFKGTVAYTSRERDGDNDLMQLVRHTIEHIASCPLCGVLGTRRDVRDAVAMVRAMTPTYSRSRRQVIIHRNVRPVRHPYYTEYTFLQKLCLAILRQDAVSMDATQKDEVSGIVFDVSWVWEEYLASVLKGGVVEGVLSHPRNRAREDAIQLFKGSGSAYPDFMWKPETENGKQRHFAVMDAKYKRLLKSNNNARLIVKVSRDDIFQMIAYLHVTEARYGFLMFPFREGEASQEMYYASDGTQDDGPASKFWQVQGYRRKGNYPEIHLLPFGVPDCNQLNSYLEYKERMSDCEASFLNAIIRFLRMSNSKRPMAQ